MASSESQYAMVFYSILYLQFIDQQQKATKLYIKAEKLDPLHAGYKANLASILYWFGDRDGAMLKAREALQLDPQHFVGIQHLIIAYTDSNDTAALASFLAGIPRAVMAMAEIESLVARGYAVQGDEKKARHIYNDLVESFDSLSPIAIMDTAWLAISLGEIDESIELMERLAKSGSFMQFWIKLLSVENSTILHNHRYQALLKRMGLDDESVAALHQKLSFD